MIPFLTEVLEVVAAGLLLAGAVPLFKNAYLLGTTNSVVFQRVSPKVGKKTSHSVRGGFK